MGAEAKGVAEAQKRTEERVSDLVQVQKEFATTFDIKICTDPKKLRILS